MKAATLPAALVTFEVQPATVLYCTTLTHMYMQRPSTSEGEGLWYMVGQQCHASYSITMSQMRPKRLNKILSTVA